MLDLSRIAARLLRYSAEAGVLLVPLLALGGEAIPDKLVVLTFDDSVASHYTVVRPLLKQCQFSATLFITEGFGFTTNKKDYMTWEQIAQLHKDGFEIGNHTRDHMGVNARSLSQLKEQVEAINARCQAHGIARPISFAYPGNAITPEAIGILKELGFKFARRGGAPEFPYEAGRGFAYEPGQDHPLLIPSAGDARPNWTLEDFKRAVGQARNGRIAVLQFHGVPDNEHPWATLRRSDSKNTWNICASRAAESSRCAIWRNMWTRISGRKNRSPSSKSVRRKWRRASRFAPTGKWFAREDFHVVAGVQEQWNSSLLVRSRVLPTAASQVWIRGMRTAGSHLDGVV